MRPLLHTFCTSEVTSRNIKTQAHRKIKSVLEILDAQKYICDMLCFALAYLQWFDARTPCNILISPCLERITRDGPHLSASFTSWNIVRHSASCLVFFRAHVTHPPQCRMVRARGSFITREQKLIEWSNTASVMPPRAAALHIITSPCLVNKIALTDYFIVTH